MLRKKIIETIIENRASTNLANAREYENGVKVALFIDFDKGRKANELIRNILEKKLF